MRLVDVYTCEGAAEVLWNLMAERLDETDVNISHREMPAWCDHLQFIQDKGYPYWRLVEADGEFVGSVNVTDRNEIGIILFRKFRGKGYGERALRLLIESVEPLPDSPSRRRGRFVANVHPDNTASRGLFEKLGGKLIQVTYEL